MNQISGLVRPVITSPGVILSAVKCVWKEVWLIETTEIQKCFHKLLNNHIVVVIMCFTVIEIPTHHASWKETNRAPD